MKQSKRILPVLLTGLFGLALLAGGCGPGPIRAKTPRDFDFVDQSRGVGGKQPTVLSASVNPAVLDEYPCDDGDKVLICHVPQGNPANKHELCISKSALHAHLGCDQGGGGHGDYLGSCEQDPTPDPSFTPAPPS